MLHVVGLVARAQTASSFNKTLAAIRSDTTKSSSVRECTVLDCWQSVLMGGSCHEEPEEVNSRGAGKKQGRHPKQRPAHTFT